MACEILGSSASGVSHAVFLVILTWAVGVNAQELWPTPPQLVGRCSTVWTSSAGKYELPYRVDFGESGSFRWWAPILLGGVEFGQGVFLSAPQSIARDDGSWEVGYFSANRFVPNPSNSTNCCCEYVGQAGPDQPRVLADYFAAILPNTAHLPMQEVCAPHVRQCPPGNATALQTFGKPFIEIYSPCVPLDGAFWIGWPSIVAALLTACVVLQLALFFRNRLGAKADEVLEEVEDEYHAMEGTTWLQVVLKAKDLRAKRQRTADTEDSEAKFKRKSTADTEYCETTASSLRQWTSDTEYSISAAGSMRQWTSDAEYSEVAGA